MTLASYQAPSYSVPGVPEKDGTRKVVVQFSLSLTTSKIEYGICVGTTLPSVSNSRVPCMRSSWTMRRALRTCAETSAPSASA